MIKPLDTLLAIKVINLVPGLAPSDRSVGVALIEHFNRRTGRCDPGMQRLAKLLNLCTRTIIRSTDRLVKAGLFEKIRHGGYSNRNSYRPNWHRFAELELAWRKKMSSRDRSRVPTESVAHGSSSLGVADSPVTQTCSSNLPNRTCSIRLPKTARYTDRHHGSEGVRFSSSAHAAAGEAEKRWMSALHQRFSSRPITYGEIIELIDEDTRAAATTAEMRIRGSGLNYILTKLKIADC